MLTDFRGGIFSPNIKDLVDAVFLLTFYAFIRSVKFTTSHITQIEIFHFMIWQFILFTKIYVLSVLNVGVGGAAPYSRLALIPTLLFLSIYDKR